MDAFWVMILVGLQCLSWSHVLSKPTTFNITLESFARQGKSRRFLQTIENGATFTVAFTGKKSERSAKFIWKTEWSDTNFHFTLRPAEMPHYILAVDNGKLVVKNTVDRHCKLEKAMVILGYQDSTNRKMEVSYEILRFLSSPGKVMKSSCNGEVFLDKRKNGPDSQAWIKIKKRM